MKAPKSKVRVIVPDFHGAHRDLPACAAAVADIKALDPDEIVFLGDGLDCAGTFSSHAKTYTDEMAESYDEDCAGANAFLDQVQKAAPRASAIHYLEGNHEGRIERWAANTFKSQKDADNLLQVYGPAAVMRLKQRGIKYYKRSEHYMGLSIPGTIKLGKCYFVHGVSHSKHAAATHLARFGANVVFGHVHRSQAVLERTVTSDGHGAWCPGALCKLQPLYMHTAPTSWSHGFGVQWVNASGRFLHVNVAIVRGASLLQDLAGRVA